jgi:outer membrane protein assembly factor BamB
MRLYILAPIVAAVAGAAIPAAEPSSAEVFLPEDAQVRALFESTEDWIQKGNHARAAEVLARISEKVLTPKEDREAVAASRTEGTVAGPASLEPAKPPPGSQKPGVISSGAGLSIGVAIAVRKYLDRLPADDQERWRELVDPVLRKEWERTQVGLEEERRLLRSRLLRDHPDSSLFPQALVEEIDDSLERGLLDQALLACRALVRSPSSSFPTPGRARAAALGARICALGGNGAAGDGAIVGGGAVVGDGAVVRDPAAAEEFRTAAKALLAAPRTGLSADLAAFLKDSLETAPAPATAPGSLAEAEAVPRSALIWTPGGSNAGGAGTGDYELGSVVWRSPLAERELRRWSAELTERTGPESEWRRTRDVSLPFFPSALGDTVVFQEYQRVFALRLPELVERWSYAIPGPEEEMVNALRGPALGPGLAVVTNADRVTALGLEDGSVRWEWKVYYDRSSRKLALYPPGWVEPKAAEEVKPPEAEAEADKDKDKDAGADQPDEKKDEKEGAKDEKEEPAKEEPEKEKEEPDEPKRPGTFIVPGEKKPKADGKPTPQPVVSLSSPVLAGEQIFLTASVRIADEVQLYALALSRSGSWSWLSSLGSFRSSDYLGQVAALAPPLRHSRWLFVPTNLGLVAALDAADGAQLWLRKYPRLSAAGRAEGVRSRSRWAPNPLLALKARASPARGAEGIESKEELVLAAPQDSSLLLAIRAEDGAVSWQVPREQYSTLIGADGENCFLGGSALSALRLQGQPGTTVWRWKPPQSTSFALGRAILAPGRILVSDNEALVQIDARSGKPLSTTLWDFRGGGGNLLLAGGFLAAAGAGENLVYDHLERARDRSVRQGDDRRHLESAKLDLKRGDLKSAFQSLTAWAELRPSDPPANSPLYRLRFELAEIAKLWLERRESREPSPEDNSLLHHYRVLLEPLPERKVVAAIEAARDLRAAGDFLGAVQHLEEALRQEVPPVPYPLNDFLSIPSVEAIRDELMAIRSAGPPGRTAFRRFEDRGEEALREARRIGTQPAFRRVIDGFPFTRAALAARRDLAEYLLNQQNPDESIRCLLELLRDFPEVEDYVAVKLRIADLLVESQRYSEAREVLEALSRERAEAKVDDPLPLRGDAQSKQRRSSSVRDLVARRLSEPPLGGPRRVEQGQSLRLPLRKRWRSPANPGASSRVFLKPEGPWPASLAGTFFARSREVIECRRVDDGYPLWTIELALIPGFVGAGGTGAGFFLTAPPRLSSRFCGDLLLIQDTRNLLAVEAPTGRIQWHRPFGRVEVPSPEVAPGPGGTPPTGKARGRIQPLGETARGLAAGPEGIFLTTSRRRVLAFSQEGVDRWVKTLDFEPASDAPPELWNGELVVFEEAPVALHFFEAKSGKPLARLLISDRPDARLIQRPIIRSDGLALLAMDSALQVVNLSTRLLRGCYRPEGFLQKVWSFPDLPEQAVIHAQAQGTPALIGVDLGSGRELWRYDKFPAGRSDISVHSDGPRLYVIHGDDRWSLLLLEIRSDSERGHFYPVPAWPNEIPVGTFFSRESERQVLVTQDALIVPDPGSSSINVYDKFKGSTLNARAAPITAFLVDKRSRFAVDAVNGVLVILTEGGDCGFEAVPRSSESPDPWARTKMVKRYVEKPDDWDNVSRLAARLFVEGEEKSALTLLDRSLLSEGLPSQESPGRFQLLDYLLNGIKEEALQDSDQQPSIACRRFRSAPVIDGEMNDSWNYATRVELRTLRSVNAIPTPGQAGDVWVGEEDLSAALYTGWDEEYFYFALDVEDSQIYPYDKGADFWKGDCLIIGIDPTGDGGFFQRPDDQLLTLALTVPKRNKPGKGAKGENEEDDEKNKPKGLFSVKKKEDNSGVVYEVALPWASFGGEDRLTDPPPRSGYKFGLSLLLTDDDTGQGATKTLSVNPCHLLPRDPKKIWRFLIPQYFPKVVLE